MATPTQAPAGFSLSQDWWDSGSTIDGEKTLWDVLVELGFEEAPAEIQAAAVESFYEDHPKYKAFVPDAVRIEMGEHGFAVEF